MKFTLLDLHAAPGGQGNDIPIADVDTTKPKLWESDLNREKTVASGAAWPRDTVMNHG